MVNAGAMREAAQRADAGEASAGPASEVETMSYPLTAEGSADDLPRTLRREKEAREREAREREAAERAQAQREALPMGPAQPMETQHGAANEPGLYAMPDPNYVPVAEPVMPASVQRFDVPFLHLVGFFLKAVVAAVPALILLAAILWVGGQVLKMLFPWLIQAQILIQFPH